MKILRNLTILLLLIFMSGYIAGASDVYDDFNDGMMTHWLPGLENQHFWIEDVGAMNWQGYDPGNQAKSLLVYNASYFEKAYTATYRSRPLDLDESNLRLGGFIYRYRDDLNYIGIVPVVNRWSSYLAVYIFKVKNGVMTQIGPPNACEDMGDIHFVDCQETISINSSTFTMWRDFDVFVEENQYSLSIDGIKIVTFEDTASDFLEHSKIGFMSFGGGGPHTHHCQWDDFYASGAINPFDEFNLVALKLKFENKSANNDAYHVAGNFMLAEVNDGINLLSEEVTIQVGTSEITIPAGSFYLDENEFKCKETINGSVVQAVFQEIAFDTWAFKIRASKVDLTGTANPDTVVLMIGNDFGIGSERLEGQLSFRRAALFE